MAKQLIFVNVVNQAEFPKWTTYKQRPGEYPRAGIAPLKAQLESRRNWKMAQAH